uniref:Related to meiosis-specific homolog n=1 Tax=Melanopsichium pennsylvanicum 4 TaxID=1398559 RepID=A0A077RBX8_9BASI|nr:related to meiosis-specific homolog [Melanopsichium pennsylvanicum 4]
MDSNAPPSSLPPQILRPIEHTSESRPGSAASDASSASSFRIPGITPAARTRVQYSDPPNQRSRTTSSFVRLFTPQSDHGQPLSLSRDRESSFAVDWLAEYGPSPRELLESSQGPSDYFRIPSPSLRITDGRLGRPSVSPTMIHKLVTADGSVGSYVCAILENRGTGREVGIASIERETGLCVITQFADTPTYVRTIHHLSMYPTSILLVPASGTSPLKSLAYASDSRKSKRARLGISQDSDSADTSSRKDSTSVLIRCLEELFEIQAWPFPRKHWNYLEGARYLDRLLVDDAHQIKDEDEAQITALSQERPVHGQQSQRPNSSRPMTGRGSLDFSAKASTRAAILVAVANKFYLLSAVAGLFE